MKTAKNIKNNIIRLAYNKKGFFNGVYNDDGLWIFSDNVHDNVERPYGPANWYSIISGTAGTAYYDKVLNVMQKLKCEMGYMLLYPPLRERPINNVGRITNGDAPSFFAENGNVYNHGSQDFLARALSVMG